MFGHSHIFVSGQNHRPYPISCTSLVSDFVPGPGPGRAPDDALVAAEGSVVCVVPYTVHNIF
jgi:hypothetical protein